MRRGRCSLEETKNLYDLSKVNKRTGPYEIEIKKKQSEHEEQGEPSL